MSKIDEKFLYYKMVRGDIEEHLETLYIYAKDCASIAELGSRFLVSTWAFLKARPKQLICVDITHPSQYGSEGRQNMEDVLDCVDEEGVDFEFYLENDLEVQLPEVDMIFIDTEHTYEQVSQELKLHGNKARKYLIFHDTNVDEVMKAILEFLDLNSIWKLENRYLNNNGLTILRRDVC